MMTPEQAYKAILQHWMTEWGTLSTPVPYAIDNRRLTQPTPPFAQVSILNLNSDQVTIGAPGNRRFERSGFIDVKLYDKRDQGRGNLDELAAKVIDIFEAIDIAGMRTYATTITEVRNDREYPDLWVLLCRTPWETHHRR